MNKYKQESLQVIQYQKEKDPKKKTQLLEELYKKRTPTLKKWAKNYHKNFYYSNFYGEDDMFQNLSLKFVEACNLFDYKKDKVEFNDYLGLILRLLYFRQLRNEPIIIRGNK